jgi:Histidine-specific methyltransferase, SAM-dependent
MAGAADSFAGSFYDLTTSMSFCARSDAIEGQSHTKIGKEVYCLERLIRHYAWEDHLGRCAINLVDLGTGSGSKAARIIGALARASVRPVNFFPVDASQYCASFAILTALMTCENLTDEVLCDLFVTPSAACRESARSDLARLMAVQEPGAPTVSCGDLRVLSRGVTADFMRNTAKVMRTIRNSPASVEGVNIVALLGQTIGNYRSDERRAFLAELFSEINDDDILLIDAGLRPEEGQLGDLEERRRTLELSYFREAIAFMLHKADHSSSRFRVAYDQVQHRVNHWFERPDGSRQFLGYSYLFSRAEFLSALADVGFRVVTGVFSVDEPDLNPGTETMVVLARKPASEP